jgi:hypothetical protein
MTLGSVISSTLSCGATNVVVGGDALVAQTMTALTMSVTEVGPYCYEVTFDDRGRSRRCEVLLAPWLATDLDLPSVAGAVIAWHAAELMVVDWTTVGMAVLDVVDLETLAIVDPAFAPRLRDTLHRVLQRDLAGEPPEVPDQARSDDSD